MGFVATLDATSLLRRKNLRKHKEVHVIAEL